MKANILGTKYDIIKRNKEDDEYLKNNNCLGYCDFKDRKIIFLNVDKAEYFKDNSEYSRKETVKETLRHEILHAFLFESGLNDSSLQIDGAWARNEEMIDWFAIQSPKIYKVYKDLDLL